MCWICRHPLLGFSIYRHHEKLKRDYQKRKRPAAPGTPSPSSSLFPGTAMGEGAPQNAARGVNRRDPEIPAVIAPEHERDPLPPPPPAVPPAPVPARDNEDVFYDDDEEEEELPEAAQQDEVTQQKRLEILGYLMPLIHEAQPLGIDTRQANKYVSWTIAAHNIQELNEAHALQYKKQLEDAIAAKKAQG